MSEDENIKTDVETMKEMVFRKFKYAISFSKTAERYWFISDTTRLQKEVKTLLQSILNEVYKKRRS